MTNCGDTGESNVRRQIQENFTFYITEVDQMWQLVKTLATDDKD